MDTEFITIIISLVAMAGSIVALGYTWGALTQRVQKHEGNLDDIESKLDARLDRLGKVEGRVETLDRLEDRVEKKVDKLDDRYISVTERLGRVMHVVYPRFSETASSVLDSVGEIVTRNAARGNPINQSELDKFNEYKDKVANKTLTEEEYKEFERLAKLIEDDLPSGEDKDNFSTLIQDALGFAAGVTFWSLSVPFGSRKEDDD